MNDDIKKLINLNILKGEATFDDAKFLIENNKLYIAINRLYYSLFYILTAISLKDGFETSKHNQLIGWFNKKYISTGLLEVDFGKTLAKLFELRNKADYDIYSTFSKEQTLDCLEKVKKFIDKIKILL